MSSTIACVDCGRQIWRRGPRKRCNDCRFAYTPKPMGQLACPIAHAEEEEVAVGHALMQSDELARTERAQRLATIRAAQTAKQQRAMGLHA